MRVACLFLLSLLSSFFCEKIILQLRTFVRVQGWGMVTEAGGKGKPPYI